MTVKELRDILASHDDNAEVTAIYKKNDEYFTLQGHEEYHDDIILILE